MASQQSRTRFASGNDGEQQTKNVGDKTPTETVSSNSRTLVATKSQHSNRNRTKSVVSRAFDSHGVLFRALNDELIHNDDDDDIDSKSTEIRRSSRLDSVAQALKAEWVIRRPTLLETLIAQNEYDAQLHAEDIATRKFNAFMSAFVQKLGRSAKFRINFTMLLPILLLFVLILISALATWQDHVSGAASLSAVEKDWTLMSLKTIIGDATHQNAQLQTRFAANPVTNPAANTTTTCPCNFLVNAASAPAAKDSWMPTRNQAACLLSQSVLLWAPEDFAQARNDKKGLVTNMTTAFTLDDATLQKIESNVYNQFCMEVGPNTRIVPPPDSFTSLRALISLNAQLTDRVSFEPTPHENCMSDYPVWSMKAYHSLMRAHAATSNLVALSFTIPTQISLDGTKPIGTLPQQVAYWLEERAKLSVSMQVLKNLLPSAHDFAERLSMGTTSSMSSNISAETASYLYDDVTQFRNIQNMDLFEDAITAYMKTGSVAALYALRPSVLYSAKSDRNSKSVTTVHMTGSGKYDSATTMFQALPGLADNMLGLIAPGARAQILERTLIVYGIILGAAMIPLAVIALLVSRRIITRFIRDIHMCIQQDHDSSVLLHLQEVRLNHILFSMLPRSMVQSLKYRKVVRPQYFESVTLFFSDVQGFTELSSRSTPQEIVNMLTIVYTIFDEVLSDYDAFKVETIGDAYSVISGAPDTLAPMKHVSEVCKYALEIVGYMLNDSWAFRIPHALTTTNERLRIRIGLHTGPITTGIAGVRVHRFILIGETFELVQKVEAYGAAQRVHISETTKRILDRIGGYECSPGNHDPACTVASVHGNEYKTYFVEYYNPNNAVDADDARESIIDAFCTDALAPATQRLRKTIAFDKSVTPSGVQIPRHVWTAMHAARRVRNRRSQVVKLVSRMVQNGLVSEQYYENIAREFDKCVYVDEQGKLQVVIEEDPNNTGGVGGAAPEVCAAAHRSSEVHASESWRSYAQNIGIVVNASSMMKRRDVAGEDVLESDSGEGADDAADGLSSDVEANAA